MGKEIHNRILRLSLIFTSIIMLMTGCSLAQGVSDTSPNAEKEETMTTMNISSLPPDIYDSQDVAVVVKKNVEAQTIQLQNISTSRRYTLNYSGASKLYDRHEQAISMQQLQEGAVVMARFYKETKALSYLKVQSDGIYYDSIDNYLINLKKGTLTVGEEIYNLSAHIVVSSNGQEIDLMDVNQMDVISIWGANSMIYGINVENGHGYLRLQNETYFVDGWVDVGDKVIKKISEDMLLVVPEGTHTVTVSNKGTSATQEITFARNEEMAWDLGEIEITVVQKGRLIFTLSPATAKLYIDGRQVDSSKPVELEYGLHRMKIMAEGYETVSQYIKVAEEMATIEAELEQIETAKETSTESASADKESDTKTTGNKSESKGNDDSDDSEKDEEESVVLTETEEAQEDTKTQEDDTVVSSDTKYKVYIDAPEGAEAYLDGNYIGIVPVSFAKKAGNYVISLRKTGYQTRSYTLQVDDEEKDVNYSFTELMKLE